MKRIEFIAPVDAMRGNLSGNKTPLVYNPDNNPAWGAPDDVRSYALNYQPQFIGAKRSNGLKFFQVKTRSAVTMSSAMREQCALLSAQSGVSYQIQHTIEGLTDVQEQYENSQYKALGWTFNRYLQTFIRAGLREKTPSFFFNAAGYTSVRYDNPFTKSTIPGSIDVELSSDILVKFWMQLADNPITYEIEGFKGVAHEGDTFYDVTNSRYDIVGFGTSEEIEGVYYVMVDGKYLCYRNPSDPGDFGYVDVDNQVQQAPTSEIEYFLTDTPPTA